MLKQRVGGRGGHDPLASFIWGRLCTTLALIVRSGPVCLASPIIGLVCALISSEARRRKPGAERPPVQILVGVASIQMRTLKTEVEKGSM
jgi:hypothetical protein